MPRCEGIAVSLDGTIANGKCAALTTWIKPTPFIVRREEPVAADPKVSAQTSVPPHSPERAHRAQAGALIRPTVVTRHHWR